MDTTTELPTQKDWLEDPYYCAVNYIARTFPELYDRYIQANTWMASPLAHGTPEWEEVSISEKVEFIHELAKAGLDPSWFLEHAFEIAEEHTDIPEGDTSWHMAGRGLWKVLQEARKRGKGMRSRIRPWGTKKRPVPVTREMLWKDIEALGGICALLETNTSLAGDAYVVERLRLLDSAKRAGWAPEALLGYAMKKLAESYHDKPGEYWWREAGQSMGRLFQWALDRRARALAA